MRRELLIEFTADFGVYRFVDKVARTHNMQLSEILKKGGLVVNQTVVPPIKK